MSEPLYRGPNWRAARRRYHQPPVRGNEVLCFWVAFAFMLAAPAVDQSVNSISAGAVALKNYVPACIDTAAAKV